MSLDTIWPWLLTALNVALASWVTVDAVLRKRDVRAAIGWTGLAWLAPLLGSVAYFLLGVNRIRRKAMRLGLGRALHSNPRVQPDRADILVMEKAFEEFPSIAGLAAVGAELSGRALIPGNRISCLVDGDQTYPAMIEAIDGADHSIGLLSYIFNSDRVGDAILDAVVRARNRGVEVRVLIDDVGTTYSKANMVKLLQDNGVSAASFLPTRFSRLPTFANLRNHRKIMVVDGRIGFTGGTNIQEEHCLGLRPKRPTQCLHFRLEGPVVAHLQETFVTDWAFTTEETLSGNHWFPELHRAGPVWARGIAHGPDEDFETLSKLIFAGLSVAATRVRVVSPYFLPDSRLVEALSIAALRGVRVEIYLPSDNNIPIVEWAAAAQLDLILQNGCRVFVSRRPFDHTKLMIVDDIWTLVGSTNWDPRSLRLNFEFNVECYDEQFAANLHRIVDRKAAGAREITLDEINGRSFPIKLRDSFVRLLSPYL